MQSLKSLLVTVLFLGAIFLAYDYYLAPDGDKVVFKRPGANGKDSTAPPAGTEPGPASVTVKTPAASEPGPSHRESPAAMVAAAPVVPIPMPGAQDRRSDVFVPPAIASVERATGNWMRIPASAFPRQARVNQVVVFKAKFGETKVAAGAEVSVLGSENGVLTLAPLPGSPLRGTAPIDATDLKATLTAAYNTWREQRIADARIAWEDRKNMPAPAVPATVATLGADGRPVAGADGAFPLLLASMRSGMVTEVTPNSITRWGSAEQGDDNGKRCWMIPVEYDARTAFGKFSTIAVAKVVDGRVAGWFYKGSGEPVP